MKRTIKRLLANLPSKLPQGMSEFDTWSNDILDTYEMPSNDSFKFALAVAILHLKAEDGFKPKAYFGKVLIKGAASQIAGAVMQDCKQRQEEAAKAEALKTVEATTSQDEAASNASQS